MRKGLFIFFLCLGSLGISQRRIFKFPSYDLVRTGSYVGYQWGNYGVFELGFERQWKELKLFKSKTTAFFGGLNYNYSEGVIGCDLGAWRKLGFLGITYGVAGIYRTDIKYHKLGFSPMLGLKISRFHLHFGYQLIIPEEQNPGINKFYTTLRFKIHSKRKLKKK